MISANAKTAAVDFFSNPVIMTRIMEGLGERIKMLRKKQRLTLVEIAERTGIDAATLSRIENGKMSGTLESHMQIAGALGIRLPELYEHVLSEMKGEDEKNAREKVETFSHSSGAVAELLTTGVLQKKMMPVLLKLKSRGSTETEELPALTERFIYVLKGNLEIQFAQDAKKLKAGESLYFSASRPHHFKNPSTQETWALSVITPVSL